MYMKRAQLFLSLMCCAASVVAQDVVTPEEATKKNEINKIKLSELAVYSDVVQMATDEGEALTLAQQKSIQMMQTHVVEICAKRLHMDKADVQEIWDVIDDKCQNIVIKKGDLFRVFTYIMKDALGLGPKKPKPGDIEKYLGPDPESQSVAEVPAVAAAPADSVEAAPAVSEDMQAAITEALAAEEADKDTIQADAYLKKPVAEAVAQPQETAKEAEPVAKAEPVKEVVVVETPQLVQTMISKSDMTTLLRFLNQEKAKQTLMYGSLSAMQNRALCYVVIVDRSTRLIVGVLDKGADERYNFVSKQTDKLDNYRQGNYSAILVQEY
jgi:hypothetical protein